MNRRNCSLLLMLAVVACLLTGCSIQLGKPKDKPVEEVVEEQASTSIGAATEATDYDISTNVEEEQADIVYVTYPGLAATFDLDKDTNTIPLYNDPSNQWYMDYIVTIEGTDFYYDSKMLAPGQAVYPDFYEKLDAGTYNVNYKIYVSPTEDGDLETLGSPWEYDGVINIKK